MNDEEQEWRELEEKYGDGEESYFLSLRETAEEKAAREIEKLRSEKEKIERVLAVIEKQYEKGVLREETYAILKERNEKRLLEIEEKLLE